ncbi:hypothetical protein DSO57_1039574 [Entomophthora muscae]|uniref:Uncharacterized protein n=1 Tax=Entomophthora muscae TaxID=34485 RepID=A0ACC2U863_9FUNG|nr:hypothetical protein DSO57_1039574 [Entomophthora muscae]
MFPPGSAPVYLVKPPCAIDLEFLHPHHLDLPPGHSRGPISTIMKKIPSTPPCPICLLPKTSVVPHTESWHPLATAVIYIVRIALVVYMAFQARPASPVGVQPDFGMGRDTTAGPLCTLWRASSDK